MISSVSSATQTQPVATTTSTSAQKAPQKASQPSSSSGDTVQISQAAQTMLAAMKEATETSAQTSKEAGQGDLQAQRLLAKEQAAAKLDAE